MNKILDEKSLSMWQQVQHCKPTMPPNLLQGMTTNARLTFSVGDTIRVVSNSVGANTISSETNRIGDTKYNI